jgi:hypothetical protein
MSEKTGNELPVFSAFSHGAWNTRSDFGFIRIRQGTSPKFKGLHHFYGFIGRIRTNSWIHDPGELGKIAF